MVLAGILHYIPIDLPGFPGKFMIVNISAYSEIIKYILREYGEILCILE